LDEKGQQFHGTGGGSQLCGATAMRSSVSNKLIYVNND
jgi:hypothetical protein